MRHSITLIRVPRSTLAEGITSRLDGASIPHRTVSIDAPFEGKPLTMGKGEVSWEGADLLRSAAIFVERSLFPWPQTRFTNEYTQSGLTQAQWAFFQRESASLAISALHLAATGCPVINPPSAAHLAVSPSIALDLLAREGIAVHPWKIEPAPQGEAAPRGDRPLGGVILDACGRDRWRSPELPGAGEPALVIEPFEGPVMTFIVAGDRAAGTVRHAGGDSWARWQRAMGTGAKGGVGEGDGQVDSPDSDPEAADLAVRSARALGLGFVAVSVRTDPAPCTVLLAEASPDLAEWDKILEGRLAEALAEHLITVARRAPSDPKASK